MKQSIANFVRALALLLLFAPAPMAIVNTPAAMASPDQVVAAAPAVEVSEPEAEASEDPWTSRFLAPASVVVAVIGVGASALYYVVRIRGRYRVS